MSYSNVLPSALATGVQTVMSAAQTEFVLGVEGAAIMEVGSLGPTIPSVSLRRNTEAPSRFP